MAAATIELERLSKPVGARVHGVDILVSEAVTSKLDDRFRLRALPPTVLKGKSEPLPVWAVEA